MPEETTLSTEEFLEMARRVGLNIPTESVEDVKATYEHFATLLARLWEFPLEDEDMAVAFSPAWPEGAEAVEGVGRE